MFAIYICSFYFEDLEYNSQKPLCICQKKNTTSHMYHKFSNYYLMNYLSINYVFQDQKENFWKIKETSKCRKIANDIFLIVVYLSSRDESQMNVRLHVDDMYLIIVIKLKRNRSNSLNMLSSIENFDVRFVLKSSSIYLKFNIKKIY